MSTLFWFNRISIFSFDFVGRPNGPDRPLSGSPRLERETERRKHGKNQPLHKLGGVTLSPTGPDGRRHRKNHRARYSSGDTVRNTG